MMRRTYQRLGISAYTLFLIETKQLPALQGLKVGARGKAVASMYRSLSATDKQALDKRAAAHPPLQRKSKKVPKLQKNKRPPSPYNAFIKANFVNVQGTPKERVKQLAQLWRNHTKSVAA
jgi:hypothetical protein